MTEKKIIYQHNLVTHRTFTYYQTINLENSRKYNGRLVSSRKGKAPIEQFVNANYLNIVKNKPGKDELNKKLAINSIIIHLLVALDHELVVTIPRKMSMYSIPPIYGLSHIKYNYTIGFLDQLINLGYVEQALGYWNIDERIGKLTRIWSTLKLVEEMNYYFSTTTSLILPFNIGSNNSSQLLIYSKFDRKMVPFQTPITLKDKNKRLIDYGSTRNVLNMRRFLHEYNDLVNSTPIIYPLNNIITNNNNQYIITPSSYNIPPLLESKQANSLLYNKLIAQLHRVFNHSKFSLGGRFYGAEYQSLNENERSKIEFNGTQTIEADFSNLHLQMIYNKCGLRLDGDAYSILGDKYRGLMKKVALIAINSNTHHKAILAFNYELSKDRAFHQLYLDSGYKTPELFDMFSKAHQKIAKYLNSGIGLKLQFEDSKIAEDIMKHFTRKGLLVAPIHDSFIIETKYKDELENVMKEVYKKHLGFNCKIKIK